MVYILLSPTWPARWPSVSLMRSGKPVITSPFEDCSEFPQTPQDWSKWLSPLPRPWPLLSSLHCLPPVLTLRGLSSPLWQFICFITCFLSIISAETNTTELSVIPWHFLSYQGGLEPTPQTLNHPCRAAFQRGCSWQPDVYVAVWHAVSTRMSAVLTADPTTQVLNQGWSGHQLTFGNCRNISAGRNQGSSSLPTLHRTAPQPTSECQIGPRWRNPGLQNWQLKSLFFWRAEAETAGPDPLNERFPYTQLCLLKGVCGLKTKCLFRMYCCLWEQSSVEKHSRQLSTSCPSGCFWGAGRR